jgi:hypothetical protein
MKKDRLQREQIDSKHDDHSPDHFDVGFLYGAHCSMDAPLNLLSRTQHNHLWIFTIHRHPPAGLETLLYHAHPFDLLNPMRKLGFSIMTRHLLRVIHAETDRLNRSIGDRISPLINHLHLMGHAAA